MKSKTFVEHNRTINFIEYDNDTVLVEIYNYSNGYQQVTYLKLNGSFDFQVDCYKNNCSCLNQNTLI